MWVRFRTARRVAGRDYAAGDVADLPDKRGEYLVEHGFAEDASAPTRAKKTAASRRPEATDADASAPDVGSES